MNSNKDSLGMTNRVNKKVALIHFYDYDVFVLSPKWDQINHKYFSSRRFDLSVALCCSRCGSGVQKLAVCNTYMYVYYVHGGTPLNMVS